ncbi:MAG TPA: hypothetical protein VKR31_07760 [Rhizomicrobium sp.]|nr:hypothetical protein [Rhizomicrobium sp.]
MRSALLSGVVILATMLAVPAMALQSVILPQPPGDGSTNAQVPSDPSQDPFATDQSNNKNNPFGAFHFNMSSGQDWPGDPYHTYRPQNSTPDAYGNAAAPGSEFSTSNLFYPH